MTADSITDAQITSYMRSVDDIADTARDKLVYIAGTTKGVTIPVFLDQLSAAEKLVRQLAEDGGHVMTAGKILCDAASRWNRAHPDDATLAAAHTAVDHGGKSVDAAMDNLAAVQASGQDDTAAQHALRKAEAALEIARKQLADVIERRERADKDLEKACAPAMDHLKKIPGAGGRRKGWGGADDYSTPGNGKPRNSPHAKPTPTAPSPSKPTAPPGTSTSSGLRPDTTSSREKLTDLLRSNGQIPQQQAPAQPQAQQAPVPAQAPTLALPASAAMPLRPDNRKSAEDALKSSDVPDVPAAVGVNPFPATTSPAAATSTAQHTPATSGTSAKDLHTEANVTGRAEGLRTMTSGTTGMLSNTTGYQGAQSQAAPQPAVGSAPMAGPMSVGGAGAGASKSSKKIHAAENKIEYEPGVVDGGTIAQDRPDRDDDK